MKNETELYIAKLLENHVGSHGLPVSLAAKALGEVSDSLVYQHRSSEGACPTLTQLFIYVDILPSTFCNGLIQLGGFTGAYRPMSVEGCVFSNTLHAVTHTTGLLQKLAEAVDDGVIDHRERLSVPAHIFSATTFLNAVAANYKDLHA